MLEGRMKRILASIVAYSGLTVAVALAALLGACGGGDGVPTGRESPAATASAAQSARAPLYSVIEIPTLGGPWSSALGLSESGLVVGASETGRCFHCTGAFLFGKDGMVELPTFGSTPRTNQANAVNNRGQVVGYAQARAFLYSDGILTDLGTLGGSWSEALAINNAGQVVGQAQDASGDHHAFLYDEGRMYDLGTLGGPWSSAHGINAAGVIVGISTPVVGSPNDRPFLYRDGTMKDLGTLGGDRGWALAINNRGDVVGGSTTNAGVWAATLWSKGRVIDLGYGSFARSINDKGQILIDGKLLYDSGAITDVNSLFPTDSGWTLEEAHAINNHGQIAGTGTLHGESRGFLLTPGKGQSDPIER
jgi:probable HAF family extracellular repeat protein